MSTPGSKRSIFYDKLHRLSIYSILGVVGVSAILLGYNVYLFKKEGIPMIVDKYRSKVEEQIEIKQREAEYLEHRKKMESELANNKKF